VYVPRGHLELLAGDDVALGALGFWSVTIAMAIVLTICGSHAVGSRRPNNCAMPGASVLGEPGQARAGHWCGDRAGHSSAREARPIPVRQQDCSGRHRRIDRATWPWPLRRDVGACVSPPKDGLRDRIVAPGIAQKRPVHVLILRAGEGQRVSMGLLVSRVGPKTNGSIRPGPRYVIDRWHAARRRRQAHCGGIAAPPLTQDAIRVRR
jgi:hypothetical protein